eukprot:TRINITY_DN4020_c0_g1_i2.p1 TRINITY_DN4020_c0_g1~~TRINITY_DN4020_c0_g1_i2.p1  ORF type:complete len:820 (+),score=305.97 TRINITY_DN4020_c0_g1_i2:85-2544(+)
MVYELSLKFVCFVDFFSSVILWVIGGADGSARPDMLTFMLDSIQHYSFQSSLFDVILISFIRSTTIFLMLFLASPKDLYLSPSAPKAAAFTQIFSLIYLIIKSAVVIHSLDFGIKNSPEPLPMLVMLLLVINIILICIEACGLLMFFIELYREGYMLLTQFDPDVEIVIPTEQQYMTGAEEYQDNGEMSHLVSRDEIVLKRRQNSTVDGHQPRAESSAIASSVSEKAEPPKKPKNATASLIRVMKLAQPEWKHILVGMFALFVASGSQLAIPQYFGIVMNTLASPGSNISDLNSAMLGAFIVLLIGGVATFFRTWIFTWAGQRLVARLRRDTFVAITRREVAFFDLTRTGELTSRLSSDTTTIQNSVTVNISMLVRSSVQALGAVIFLFAISWRLTLIMLSVVPVVAIGAVIYGKFLRDLSKQFQESLADASSTAEECLANMRTIRSFSREKTAQIKYSQDIDATYEVGKKTALYSGGFTAVLTTVSLSMIALVMYEGGREILVPGDNNALSLGSLASFVVFTLMLAMSLGLISSLFGDFMSAVGASERVFQLIDEQSSIPVEGGDTLDRVRGKISLDHVFFKYPTRPDTYVLKDVCLDLEPGSIVALVGPSGGGKSSIVSLIERFYDPSEGCIKMDDVDIKTLDPRWYRQQIGFVSQEPVLFASTIRDNICFGVHRPYVSDREVYEAAVKANAHDFIDRLEDGYDTLVGERGVRLSGGQKQRIAIARALLMNPSILLLDEATSALDSESEHLVQEAIDRAMQNRTVMIIAHRLSTVRNANQVLVISDGCVVERGNHETLMGAPDGIYRKLVKRQLQAE